MCFLKLALYVRSFMDFMSPFIITHKSANTFLTLKVYDDYINIQLRGWNLSINRHRCFLFVYVFFKGRED